MVACQHTSDTAVIVGCLVFKSVKTKIDFDYATFTWNIQLSTIPGA